ncbi:AAA domain-containing protein [Roseivirga spongicola]|uniref:S1 motif domain-containing protein n=1 Tax=Roseivirga spongicola TaxID=333140 RepID=A0A150X1P8_9BACT|nr:AAA domain-containing protein [Roseivirga spongicola]KYG72659.1 hypothetical protein AWW68_17335 [Roseivirga spongicola]WPZ10261.1 AAA domain-containing protein [Roseivirga spongicola]
MAVDNYSIEQFSPGTLIETEVKRKIEPGVLELDVSKNFTSTISILDLDWNLTRAEIQFKSIKEGDRIKAAVYEITPNDNHIRFSVRHLLDKPIETDYWKNLKLGDIISGKSVDVLSTGQVVELQNDLTGIIFDHSYQGDDFQLVTKDRETNLLILSKPVQTSQENDLEGSNLPQSSIVIKDEDFRSFESFTKSIYNDFAGPDELEFLESAFEAEPQLFSKELVTNSRLYLSFGLNHSAWDNFQAQVIPSILNKANDEEKIIKEAFEHIEKQSFWINLSKRNDKEFFTIYNDQLNFHGVINEFDEESCQFFIFNASFGRKDTNASRGKQISSKIGSYVLVDGISLLSPTDNVPIGESKKQVSILRRLQLKSQASIIFTELKMKTGEIIRSEGKSLQIFDKFLEYQIDHAKKNLPPPFPLSDIQRTQGGEKISWILPPEVDDYFGKDEEGEIYLDLRERIKSNKKDRTYEYKKFGSAKARQFGEVWLLEIEDSLPLKEVKELYIQKKASLRQYQVQREIIRDFFDKKLKLDHVENLLVNPKRIKTPFESQAELFNENLRKTEDQKTDNRQVKAVRKAIGNKDIFLIQGPPGTGKTTVITEVVRQLVSQGEKVLVTSQTHIAVDNVLEKLTEEKSLSLLRLGVKNKIRESLQQHHPNEQIKAYTKDFLRFIDTQIAIIELWELKKSDEEIRGTVKVLREEYSPVVRDKLAGFNFDLVDLLKSNSLIKTKSIFDTLNKWKTSVESGLEIIIAPILYSSVDVVFATCIGIKLDQVFNEIQFQFDTVIIDEAGKANLAESLVAISMAKKIILVGDQKQLPPYIESDLLDPKEENSFPKSKYGFRYGKEEIEYALKTSFFEFLTKRIDAGQFPLTNKEMLNYQHRMHPNIGRFVSESFYDGDVKMGSSTHLNELALPAPFNKEIIFFSTGAFENPYERQKGFSIINQTEAQILVQDILPKLLEFGVKDREVAVIAPYKSQVALIKTELEASAKHSLSNIEVATLDSFQGMEFDIIVFSFTRSASPDQEKKKVGFLDDARRLNVAFSRAKKKLILIGNSRTLTQQSSHYDGLFPFTKLFQKLVELSNDENIGAFYETNDDDYDFKSPHERFQEKYPVGSNVKGVVKAIVPYGAFVTIDGLDGLVHKTDISQHFVADVNDHLEVDQEVDVKVLKINIENKQISLGIKQTKENVKARTSESRAAGDYLLYEEFKKKFPVGSKVRGKIKIIKDYGMFITSHGLDGLLHISNIGDDKNLDLSQDFKVKDEIQVVLLDYNDELKKFQLGLKQIKEIEKWEVFKEANPAQTIIKTTIKDVAPFGIFVTFDSGFSGLVHISQLNPKKRNEIKKHYSKGDPLDVMILSYKDQKRQIELSETMALLKNKGRHV